MPPAEVTDCSADDFSAGTTDEGAYVARTRVGEVTLAPKVAGEFTGPDLPEGWTVTSLRDGGRGTFEDGMLALDGARLGCEPLLPSPRSLEFSAVFAARPDQHAGFGTNFVDVPWVMFSTKWGRRLYGRTHLLNIEDKRLAGHWFGAPHRFRIDWNVLDIVFSIDGEALGRLLVPVPGFMRALAANQRLHSEPLRVEWMRLSPFAPSGRFTSRVLGAGMPVDWHAVTWEAEAPGGTSLRMQIRTGDNGAPDPTWSPWMPVEASGDTVPATSRYLQYAADLASADSAWTPVLRRVTVGYSATADPAPAAGGDFSRSSGSGRPLGCQ